MTTDQTDQTDLREPEERPRKLLRNAAECALCYDVIESKHRHDFVTCSCYSDENKTGIFVDGGLAYVRRGAYNLGHIIDRCEWGDA